MADIIQLRGGTAAAWTAANPILANKELGVETDTRKMKLGNGVANWNTLSYMSLAANAVGSDKQIPFNDGGTMSGLAALIFDKTNNHLEIGLGSTSGAVCLVASSTDEVAEPGELVIYAKTIGGRVMPKWIGPANVDTPIQPFLGMNHIACWQAGGGTTLSVFGATTLTATGTATAATSATGNKQTEMIRLEYLVTVAATTAVAGFRHPTAHWCMGNAAGVGGFFFVCRFGLATGVSGITTNRVFVGLASVTTAPTDAQPSAMTQMVGIGTDAADTSWQIMSNDGTGTATKISLSTTDFAIPTVDRVDMFELVMFCKPGGTTIDYRFTNLGTAKQVSGTITTDLPTSTTMLAPRGYHSVGGTNSVIGITLSSLYIESDY